MHTLIRFNLLEITGTSEYFDKIQNNRYSKKCLNVSAKLYACSAQELSPEENAFSCLFAQHFEM